MLESILKTIKKMLDIPIEDSFFDQTVLVYINSAFSTLHQLGVGPTTPYIIEGESETWQDFSTDINKFALVKSFVFCYVKLLFDPPQTGHHLEAMKQQKSEMEFRLSVSQYNPE